MDFGRFECLSFDCYGTLIDWERGICSALRPVLKAHEIQTEDEALLELYAQMEREAESGPYMSYREVLQSVLRGMGTALGFRPTADELNRFPRSIQDWPAFSDSREALLALSTRYKLIILSNVDDDLFRYSSRKLGVEFYQVCTAQQIGSYKPSLRNFEYLIQHAAVPKHKLLHVAQSLYHDIAPANQMGIPTAWVNRRHGLGGSGATPQAKAEPDVVVADLRSLALMTGVLTDAH
jgi:2-haloacid dehalogenase